MIPQNQSGKKILRAKSLDDILPCPLVAPNKTQKILVDMHEYILHSTPNTMLHSDHKFQFIGNDKICLFTKVFPSLNGFPII